MLASVRELARTLLAILETRARLAATELEEQAARLVEIALWFALAILFLSVALVFVSVLVLLAFWDSNRMFAAGFLAALYLSGGGAAALIARAPARASAAPLRHARRARQGPRALGTPAVTRDRLIALSQQRARLVGRARVEREHLGAVAARIESTFWWVDAAHKGVERVRRHPLLLAAGIVLLAALRPRGAVKLLASSWSLWQLYQRARRLWTVAAGLVAGAAVRNR